MEILSYMAYETVGQVGLLSSAWQGFCSKVCMNLVNLLEFGILKIIAVVGPLSATSVTCTHARNVVCM